MKSIDTIVFMYGDGRPPVRIKDCYYDNPVTMRRESLDFNGAPNGDSVSMEEISQKSNMSTYPWGTFRK